MIRPNIIPEPEPPKATVIPELPEILRAQPIEEEPPAPRALPVEP